MANDDKRGEFSYFYYQIGDYDTTDSDATILADSLWIEMCVIDVTVDDGRAMNSTDDRCSPQFKTYTSGKRDVSVSVNLNELRITDDEVAEWDQNLDSGDIFALLVLTDARTVTTARGFVGNFIHENDNRTQPQEGNNTEAITFRPAARSAFQDPIMRRIYGSAIPAAS